MILPNCLTDQSFRTAEPEPEAHRLSPLEETISLVKTKREIF